MGMAGMVEYSRAFLGAWEDVRAEIEEYRELDDERVLVFVQASARGKTSGLEVGPMRTTHATLERADQRPDGLAGAVPPGIAPLYPMARRDGYVTWVEDTEIKLSELTHDHAVLDMSSAARGCYGLSLDSRGVDRAPMLCTRDDASLSADQPSER
jgi:hypothetical protein